MKRLFILLAFLIPSFIFAQAIDTTLTANQLDSLESAVKVQYKVEEHAIEKQEKAIRRVHKGDKSININLNGFSGDWGFGKDATRNLSVGLSFSYALTNDFTLNTSINTGFVPDTYSLTYSVGFKYHPKMFVLGLSYNGGTRDTFKSYSNVAQAEFGYTFSVGNRFSIEPTINYQKSIGTTDINRIGCSVNFGISL